MYYSYVLSISKWIFSILALISIVLLTLFMFIFENYEVIGEKIECTTNSPFKFNYTCELYRFENNTQIWSFEGIIPDGVTIPNIMVR